MRWPWTRAAAEAEDHADAVVDALATKAEAAYENLRTEAGRRLDEVNGHLNALAERLDDLTPLPKPPITLDVEEKGRMQMAWATSVCPYCQHAHSGVCPRVRRAEYDSAGRTLRVWFWPEGRWQVPSDALSVEDVFGSPVALPKREEQPSA
jgi:hypothetical protein